MHCYIQVDGVHLSYQGALTDFLTLLLIDTTRGGAVTCQVECWTCDQQVVGSNPTPGKSCITTLSKLFTPMCLCHRAV